jgi:hypothetical protein
MKKKVLHRYILLLFVLLAGIFESCEIVFEDTIAFDQRDLVTGTYDIDEYSETEGLSFNYNLEIYKSVRYHKSVIIYNLYDSGSEVIADIYDNGRKIKIPRQLIHGLEFEGAGTLYGSGELSLIYTVHDKNSHDYFVDFLSATGWKYQY